ncbi:hypothetical protein GCM10009716_21420 [Streptomyces sodiiphilus]|uniref:Uncharacterized protein n=1 Tax=Streptomyces sodiiphilus TaxID=226217 RepID=A0ABN2P4A8_9ACTN
MVAVGGCGAGIGVAVVRERLGVGQLPGSLLAGFGEPYGGGDVAEVDGLVREPAQGGGGEFVLACLGGEPVAVRVYGFKPGRVKMSSARPVAIASPLASMACALF